MALPHEDVIHRITAVFQSLPGIPKDTALQITVSTNIVRDLKLDSIAVMDFIMEIEAEFDTVIPLDTIVAIQTVGDLAGALSISAETAV